MIKYQHHSDLVLIQKSRQGDEGALISLMKRYEHVVWYKARRYAYNLNDIDDFVQEGQVALYEAIYSFEKDKQATFTTFIDLCIDRKLTSYIRKQTTTKTTLLTQASSFNERTLFSESTLSSTHHTPETLLLQKIQSNELKRHIVQTLSDHEQQVVLHYLADASLNDIAIMLNKSYKSVDNAMQRAIKKLRKHFI